VRMIVRDDGDLLERLLGFDGRDLKEEKEGLWQRAREHEELAWSSYWACVDVFADHPLNTRKSDTASESGSWRYAASEPQIACTLGRRGLYYGSAYGAHCPLITEDGCPDIALKSAASMQEATRLGRIAAEAQGSMPTVAKTTPQKRCSSDRKGV
jgi:hypothetical protein